MNYLSKLLPVTAEEYEPLRQIMLSKIVWIWNSTYQHLHDKAKAIIKKNATMVLYDEKEQLYLETDT